MAFFVADRTNGDLLGAYPFVSKITWAKGFDLKTKNRSSTGRPPGQPV